MQNVGSLPTRDGLITFAGINSSQADQNAGKNAHLRSFEVKYPPRKKQKTIGEEEEDGPGSITPVGKASLFQTAPATKNESYQRLLRLSPAQGRDIASKRIGAIASSMAKTNELVVFSATNATPEPADVITRIELPEDTEAADVDIIEPERSQFSIAYCTEDDIYEQTIKYDFDTKRAEKTPNGPRRLHQMPQPDALGTKSRPKFRCVRFLNAQNLVLLVNKPEKKGAELRIVHLYPTGPAALVLTKNLSSRIRQCTSMDVLALDVDAKGNQQVAVAVAAQDISIDIFVTNYTRSTDTFSPFKHYITLRDVHNFQITKIAFSRFHTPTRAPERGHARKGSDGKPLPQRVESLAHAHPGPQYVQLASVSYGNSVAVETMPLSPLDPKDKNSRYMLSHPSDEKFTQWAYITIISLIVVVAAFIIQSFTVGFSAPTSIGPFSLLPRDALDFMDAPAGLLRGQAAGKIDKMATSVGSALDESVPSNMPGKARLRELLSAHASLPDPHTKALVIRDGGDDTELDVNLHPDKEAYVAQDAGAKRWDDLEEHQREAWKQRLIKAGEWTEDEGVTVFKGILFSTYAGMVGQAAQQAMAG